MVEGIARWAGRRGLGLELVDGDAVLGLGRYTRGERDAMGLVRWLPVRAGDARAGLP